MIIGFTTGKPANHDAPVSPSCGYWYKTERTGSAQMGLFAEEERDDLPFVNKLREDVRRWREADYRGASNVTKALLQHWARENRPRRLFFCQREAVETVIYLTEYGCLASRVGQASGILRCPTTICSDSSGRTAHLRCATAIPFRPSSMSRRPSLLPLRRLGCKMATGAGKTVVMAMLMAWAFCNRGVNPQSREFPHAVLVCCPNLTVKERLQVLRPDRPDNYYAAFDLVPIKYRPLLQTGQGAGHQLACLCPGV